MTTLTQRHPQVGLAGQLSRATPVELVEDDSDGKSWLKLWGRWVRIATLENLWDIDGHVQLGLPVLRMRFRATTEEGASISLFQDLLKDQWYQELPF